MKVFPDKNGLVQPVLVKSRNAVFKRIAKLCLILKTEEREKERRQLFFRIFSCFWRTREITICR